MEIDLQYSYTEVAAKVALASGVGLLVGLEREWTQKEMGARTFAITALLGMLSTLLSADVVVATMMAVLLLIAFLNVHSLLRDRSLELTTSISLVVVFVQGALVGQNYFFAASTSAIVMVLILALKLELKRFTGALRRQEIRSAVLLGLLSVVVYPLLPDRFIDPWDLVNPRQAWTVIVVVAGIGFANYVLLRLYRTKGIYYSALLGGLVNSTAAVAELSRLIKASEELALSAPGILLLTNFAMFFRNGVILAIFAPLAALSAAAPLAIMAAISAAFSASQPHKATSSTPINLTSPVSLPRVLKFGVAFLALSIVGTLAQRTFGSLGFLVVSVAGGLISSASTTASAAALAAAGKLSPETAGMATVITSISSAVINIPLVYQQTHDRAITQRLTLVTFVLALVGIGASFAVWWLAEH